MIKSDSQYKLYMDILRRELIPALGCTEPIAVALAGAKAREVLGDFPDEIIAQCSGNIIKNVMGVIVPGTGNMRGIDISAVLGVIVGDSSRSLQVLSGITMEDAERARELCLNGICRVEIIPETPGLHIILTARKDGHVAIVEICDEHTNIIRVEKDGEIVFEKTDNEESTQDEAPAYGEMSLAGIYDFANSVDIDDIRKLIDSQIECNNKIAEEGLSKGYGAHVGPTLVSNYGSGVENLAKAYCAAGSDARMSGCTMPVVINSGSGNQGLTVSLPVIQYARAHNVSREVLYRSLVLSNLTAIHQKTGIGRLSAYCGAVSAACGSGAGIAYMFGNPLEVIEQTVVNTVASASGIVCDGAKPSCAAKIAVAVDAALLGYKLALSGYGFKSGEGIVKDTAEDTIRSVGVLASEGMRKTDDTILNIMINS